MALQQLRMVLLCGCVTFLCLRGVLFEWIHNLHVKAFEGGGGGGDGEKLGFYDRRAMEFKDDRIVNAAAEFAVDDKADAGRFKLLWAEEPQTVIVDKEEELLQHMLGDRRLGGHGAASPGRFNTQFHIPPELTKQLTMTAAELRKVQVGA